MALDLGGIAKGWTVDNMAKNFESKNISATLDIGGNLRIINPAGRKSITGIRDPRFPEKIERKITISSRSCSSSDGYERFVHYNNKYYAHIMDPSTGYPAEKCLAVTVMTDSAPDADWMSTAVFIRGKELAEKLVKKYPGTTVYIYLPGNEKKVLLIQ